MRVRDIMTGDFEIATLHTTLRQASELMRNGGFGFLPVKEGDKLRGAVTDRDIVVRGLADGFGPETPVIHVLSETIVYCFEDDDVREAADLMQTPGDTRERLIAGSYSPRPEIDELAYGEIVFQMSPQVAAIEQRLRIAVKEGRLPTMPQSLPEFTQWVAHAARLQLVSDDEQQVLGQYADYAARAVAVDDFPADFGRVADMQRAQRQEPADTALIS